MRRRRQRLVCHASGFFCKTHALTVSLYSQWHSYQAASPLDWTERFDFTFYAVQRYNRPMNTFSVLFVILLACSGLLPISAVAGSATWKLNPTSGDWNTAANWTPASIPNGPSDIATFAVSNTTGITLSATTKLNGIVFNASASAYTIDVNSGILSLTIGGIGVENDSTMTQNFISETDGWIFFQNSATAGSGIIFTSIGEHDNRGSGLIIFEDTSSAGNATFICEPGGYDQSTVGAVYFYDSSTAGNGTFICNGASVAGAGSGYIEFDSASTAGTGTFTCNGGTVASAPGGAIALSTHGANATFIINGSAVEGAYPGALYFSEGNLEDATVIANGGVTGGSGGLLFFNGTSHGDRARVELSGNALLDISAHERTKMTIGSLSGGGFVHLGANVLSVGSNNLNTTFSGVIQDAGTLEKVGGSKLTLSNANTYGGGTIVRGGGLLIRNSSGSGTGSGPVNVKMGSLGGTGIIAGAVTLGTGTGGKAFLTPGSRVSLGTLTIQSTITFMADATYDFALNSSRGAADEVVANGVTINSATFSYVDNGTAPLSSGTTFTAIGNTAATPISGRFSNLPDGGLITIGPNTFQANYEGGDGNDLTLTVVP